MTDTELLDWLQENGEGYALVSDDFGRWCCSSEGMQNVPEDPSQPADIQTTHFVSADQWQPNVREAIKAAHDVPKGPN